MCVMKPPPSIAAGSAWAAVLALLLITGLLRLAWVYHDLTAFSVQGKNDSAATIVQKTEGLLKIAETEPLLRYYAQLSLTRRANPADPMVQPWAEEAALQALYFRPYANTYQVGLYQQRSGQAKEAAEWLQKLMNTTPICCRSTASAFMLRRISTACAPKWLKIAALLPKAVPKPNHARR